MAELHGELLEFNEMLQRQLVLREKKIKHIKQELVALRGPLPDEVENDDPSTSSEDSNSTVSRPLINIWIPSVFLKGKGADAHHLYQVGLQRLCEYMTVIFAFRDLIFGLKITCFFSPSLHKSSMTNPQVC